jgi:DNA-binding transcriptional regulator YiaG
MSPRSSFREAIARPAVAAAAGPSPSASPTRLLLEAAGEIARPVDLVRALRAGGVSLKRAHAVLERLAEGGSAAVEVAEEGEVVARLEDLGVAARALRHPEVSVREVRTRLGLSQAEFALSFGLELDTVRNWEQGRNRPDPAMRVLLAIIERRPEIVRAVLTEPTRREGGL